MSYRHLPMSCEAGHTPSRIVEVGFTDDHELVVHFWCEECNRVVYVSKPLSDCWRDCPGPEAISDAQFLQSLGIRFP